MNKVLTGALVLGMVFLVLLLGVTLKNNSRPDGLPMADTGLSGELLQHFQFETASESGGSMVLNGEQNGTKLRLHIFRDWSPQMAESYISDKMFVINSLYREIHSPYPGALSNRIACADEFKPKRVEYSPFDYYRIYATDRLTYGACSRDLISYQTILYFIYCDEDNSFYQLELFVPVNEPASPYEGLLTSLVCSSSSSTPRISRPLLKDGEPWWPLGQNVAWIEPDDPNDYEYYLGRLHDAGVELVRVVLVPWSLHESWNSSRIDEGRVGELKALLGTAAELNMSVILSLDIYGELRTNSSDPREMLWSENPYNAANGGPAESPAGFFTNGEARQEYKKRLDLLVSEVGDSEALFAWEFWNEADLTDGFDANAVCDWHAEVAAYLKSIDSRERYITTSFADFRNGDCVWRLDDIGLVMVHYYGRDVIERIPELYTEASAYGKPVLLEEFGWGNAAGIDNEDASGEHLREAIVAARSAGFAAGPMIWWWDSYVEQNNLYSVYTSMD